MFDRSASLLDNNYPDLFLFMSINFLIAVSLFHAEKCEPKNKNIKIIGKGSSTKNGLVSFQCCIELKTIPMERNAAAVQAYAATVTVHCTRARLQ